MTDQPPAAADEPDRRADRVAVVHRQARRTLLLAVGFTVAAAIVVVVPTSTGRWVPLHLFFVGGLLLAVSGATPLLAVTWSTSIPPPDAVVRWQRLLLAAGAVGLVLARELDLSDVVVVVAGSGLGLARAVDAWPDRAVALGQAHMVANLYGLVGIVVAATLPFFVATQIRSKMGPRASAPAIRTVLVALAVAAALASAGAILEAAALTAVGLVLYAVGLMATVGLCPRPVRRQLRWAGPRVWLLATGMAWWVGATVALAVEAAGGRETSDRTTLVLVAVGGFLPIVLGSLAYFGPVLRGGGHERLTEGFGLTRSWLALGACNVAAVGLAASQPTLAAVALGVLAVDVVVRLVLLIR
ncbi:hypothetical protein [Rhabdothermincola salaria]|uniref:hypothetical protein n=1 Tax=Rhabdothermincola salaria TaxID=2903142 RepID=UPI001E314415|nr:hypothetical protein [Rhabdothermincola salaria]MCD9622263.1 hypothetical protein [Rhabdothermincola salaria]